MSESINAQDLNGAPAPTALPTAAAMVVRVNLLPARYRDRAQARRGRLVAVVLVAGSVAVVGGLWVLARADANAAAEQVAAAQATNQALMAEAATYAEVPAAFRTVEVAQAQIAVAMASEIRWSFVLNDLSLTIPQGVSLTTMAVTGATPTADPAAGATTDADPTTTEPVVASIAYDGEALDYPKVSEWLDSQAKQALYTNVYLGSATKLAEAGQAGVTFSSSSDVTALALSNRFDAAGTEVG